MTFEEYEKAGPQQLKAEAKACFEMAQEMAGGAWERRASKLLEAQFYMQELDRREGDRVSNRDFWMEVVVIALILLELILGIVGIIIGIREGNDQAQVLSKLNTSAAATANTLTALQSTTKTMNDAVQAQLGFAYAVSVEIGSELLQDRMKITNKGQTDITLWGSRFGNEPVIMEKVPKVITSGGSAYVLLPKAYDHLMEHVQIGTPTPVSAPFQAYIKDHNGEQFAVNSILTGDMRFVPLDLKPQSTSVIKQQWSSRLGPDTARPKGR
jgi:hypothetical protein